MAFSPFQAEEKEEIGGGLELKVCQQIPEIFCVSEREERERGRERERVRERERERER